MASKLFNYGAGIGSVFAGSRVAGKGGGYLPGMYAKSFPNVIEALNSSTSNGVIEFGELVVRDTTGSVPFARSFVGTDGVDDIYGIALKDVKSPTTISDNIVYAYHLGDQISVLRNGQVAVAVQNGSPAIGGQVYVRIAASLTNTALVVGGFETALVENETVAVPGWTFESAGYYPANAQGSGSTTTAKTGRCATIRIKPIDSTVVSKDDFDALEARVEALES